MPCSSTLRRRVPIKWGHIGQEVLVKNEKRREQQRQAPVYRSFEYEDLESYKQLRSSGRLRLESFEAAFRYFFEHSPLRLGYMQKKLVDEIKVAFLRKLFGDELVANLGWLSQKFTIEELNDTLCIRFPRYVVASASSLSLDLLF